MLNWDGKTAQLHIDYYPSQEKEVYGDKESQEFNKIFWWDNFQVLSHLLKEYRWKVNLIYIDPPFDSKADYVKTIKFRWKELAGKEQNLFEEAQYSDIRWKDEYLQFMYERLLLLRELLTENWSIYLHCDWHKNHHLRCIMDEIFGEENFVNEIIWNYTNKMSASSQSFPKSYDTILFYKKTSSIEFNTIKIIRETPVKQSLREGRDGKNMRARDEHGNIIYEMSYDKKATDVWDIPFIASTSSEKMDYPTQKPEKLLERIISASSNPWDLVMDCFMGSGTTIAVAQKLGRKWIGCDINTGAINTTISRLNTIIEKQIKDRAEVSKRRTLHFANVHIPDPKDHTNILWSILPDWNPFHYIDWSSEQEKKWFLTTPLAFKVYNVNEYNLFKNKDEGIATYKEILMESYGVESVRGYFDGKNSWSYVKIIDPNRILSKKDIDDIMTHLETNQNDYIYSNSPLKYYDIDIICSGKELDIEAYIRKKNTTSCTINVRDILIEKEGIIFKEKPVLECKIEVKKSDLSISINDFISPVLLKKLEIENKGKSDKTLIEDRKQTIDSIAIDADYDDKLFNAEIIDNPSKKETVKGSYSWQYSKKGKFTLAIKIIDILGEELFETYDIEVK